MSFNITRTKILTLLGPSHQVTVSSSSPNLKRKRGHNSGPKMFRSEHGSASATTKIREVEVLISKTNLPRYHIFTPSHSLQIDQNGNTSPNTQHSSAHSSSCRIQTYRRIQSLGLDPKSQWPAPHCDRHFRQDSTRLLAEKLYPTFDT